MTELTIRPEEIKEALQKFVSDYQPEEASREEVGTVAEAGDGIARVEGLLQEIGRFECDLTPTLRLYTIIGAHCDNPSLRTMLRAAGSSADLRPRMR